MLKKSRLSACMGAALALMAANVQAQEAQKLERIEVTGSRLLKLTTDSPSPLQVITAEEIAKSGVANIQDLLLKNPAIGTPAISRTNSNFSTSSAGVATIDLRNLGSDRTLVLVNGRRFVAGIPTSATVDLNTIPADFIERVEIMTGGASASYGSDAVAGVVNIILKKNFQGFTGDIQRGQAEEGDDIKTKLSLTYGANSGDGKANLMLHVGATKQGAVYSKDRAGNEIDNASTFAFITGDPADVFKVTYPFYSSFAPAGRFFPVAGTAGSRTFDANGNMIPFSTNGPAGDGVGATGFNRQASRTIAIPTTRYLFAAKGDVQIADNHNVWVEGNYAASTTRAELEPFPLQASGNGGIYPGTNRVPAQTRLADGTIVRNPLIPQALFDLMTDTNGDGLRDYDFTRRMSEFGNRGATADRDTFRVVAGANGLIGGSWDYELYTMYGSNKEAQVSGGQVNVLNFRHALEVIPDANGNPICRDADARRQGCAPANIFGAGKISAAAVNYIQAPTLLATFTTQKMSSATVRGELLELPAGPWSLALGGEYREEYSRTEFDPLAQAGLNAGNAIPRTEGKFDVTEFFAETRIPLLKKVMGAESLTLTGIARQSKYSTIGNTTSWNAGIEWAPISDLKVRASTASAIRAPNIGELYSPGSQTFPTGINDPCVGVTATSAGRFDAACRAAPGVGTNIAANGAFTLTQPDLQGISGFNSGNPALGEENAKSTTFGVAFAPRNIDFLRNFSFTADYFRIEIEDAITGVDRNFILEQCYGGDAFYCRFVTRRPTALGANSAGSLEFVNSTTNNSGGLTTSGIDITAAYADRVGPGNLNARLSYTHLISGYVVPLPGAERNPYAGELGAAKDKFTLNLGYTYQGFGASGTVTYIGKSYFDNVFLAGYDLGAESLGVPAKTYLDLNFSYTMGKTRFYVGIDNALATKAPIIASGMDGNTTGTLTNASVYDAIGRRYYVGMRVGF